MCTNERLQFCYSLVCFVHAYIFAFAFIAFIIPFTGLNSCNSSRLFGSCFVPLLYPLCWLLRFVLNLVGLNLISCRECIAFNIESRWLLLAKGFNVISSILFIMKWTLYVESALASAFMISAETLQIRMVFLINNINKKEQTNWTCTIICTKILTWKYQAQSKLQSKVKKIKVCQ